MLRHPLIFISCRTFFGASIESAEWLPEQGRATDFASSSKGEQVYVATARDEQIVGFVSVQAKSAVIHHLYVHPDFRSQGVGYSMLLSLREWLPTPWQLKCVLKNQQALAFYLKNGWREVGKGESEDGAFVVLEMQRY